MNPVVADASVVAKVILEEAGHDAARGVVAKAAPLLAPELIFSECANALWKRVHRGSMASVHALRALEGLWAVPLEPLSLRRLTPAALQLSLDLDHPIYDCYYLAAAIQDNCTLATADQHLYELAQRMGFGEQAVLVR